MQGWQTLPIALAWAILVLVQRPLQAREWFAEEDAAIRFDLLTLDDSELSEDDAVPLPDEGLEPDGSRRKIDPGLDVMGPPGKDRSPFMSKMYGIPNQDVKSQSERWSQSGEQVSIAAPFYIATGGGNIWLATGTVDHLAVDTNAIFLDSQFAVPEHLWKILGGVMNFRDLDNGWKTATILKVGSVSDQPFASIRDMTVTVIGSLEIPFRERDAWNFSLYYSPTSQLPFPLPGLAYVWRPSDQLRANIGIPFSWQYQPTETFSVVGSYFPITDVNLMARQQLSENWTVYGGYQIVNDAYWLNERLDDNERLYLFDQRLTIGLQRKLVLGFSMDVSGGYVFDRRVFQAEGFSDSRRDEIEIDPGAMGAVQLSWSL
jgi:Domain of unknown function (DUF6268)